MNKVEPSRESAMLSGCLPGHSRRMHRDRTELFSGDLGMRSPNSLQVLLEGGRKLLRAQNPFECQAEQFNLKHFFTNAGEKYKLGKKVRNQLPLCPASTLS